MACRVKESGFLETLSGSKRVKQCGPVLKVIISSFGSSGDFNPCLGLGRALRRKGVDVIFLSNPFYEKQITDAGLRFAPAGEYFDVFREIRDNPAYLHAHKGPPAVWKLVLKTLPVMHQDMSNLIESQSPDIVACHLLEFGGMLAAVEHKTPYATLTPTPMGWFNPNYPSYVNFYRLPRWVRSAQARLGVWAMKMAFRYSLTPFCKKHAIRPVFKNLDAVFAQARLNLGLWSPLLRDKVKNDPPRSTICGFVRDEHIRDWPNVPREIARLFEGPKPPVVVGLGSTASLHGAAIYQNAARACRKLNWPCLLIGKDISPLADPENRILAVDFAPYGWVFPRAELVIHHGGVNTTAETLRAGIPAIVIPHGYDQFDNAVRTQQMGLSIRLKTRQTATPACASTMQYILNNQPMHDRAKAFAARLCSQPDGDTTAAENVIKVIQDT